MYNYNSIEDEDEKKINWISLFVKVAVAVVLIIIFVWLISLIAKKSNTNTSQNINLMKEAGEKYFTEERLPELNSSSVKVSLNGLYSERLIDTITDKNGKACDSNKSYILLTKYNDGYNMKIYLKCSKIEEKATIVMKQYSYCKYTICEKDNNNKDETIITKPNKYKYIKPGYFTDWGDFTPWTTDEVKSSDIIKVETKVQTTTKEIPSTVKEIEKTNIICPQGYSMGNGTCVKSNTSYTEPICGSGYISRNGFTCTYKGQAEKKETYQGTETGDKIPNNTNDYRYEYVSSKFVSSKGKFQYTYKIYKITYTQTTYTGSASCPSGYSRSGNSCISSTTSNVDITCPKNYNISDDKTYCYRYVDKQTTNIQKINTTYYRYATRQYIEEDIKYGKSSNDQELINKGYKLYEE